MAKLGNEAKLLLRLAKERMEKPPNPKHWGKENIEEERFMFGWNSAIELYNYTLNSIVGELEEGRL
jgi:hypothetical protein